MASLFLYYYSVLQVDHACAWSHHPLALAYRNNAVFGNLNRLKGNDHHGFHRDPLIAFQSSESDSSSDSDTLAPPIPHLVDDNAPSWEDLRKQLLATSTGKRLQLESIDREKGHGPPHAHAKFRLFDAKAESEIRVTFYRDQAAWCPYCQKVWLLLEEKRIPYRVKTVPLNAYGDKPAWYTRLVDGGKLPTLELDGTLYRESLEIMKVLDDEFPDCGPKMFPSNESNRTNLLFELEQELQRDWFSLTFYPVEGGRLRSARTNLLQTLQKVDDELGKIKSGPWFLGGDAPSAVDLQYVTTVERIIASVLYYKGLVIRGKFVNVDEWLAAFERRSSYAASKSDYYTLIMAMPSQNGPGYMTAAGDVDDDKNANHDASSIIYGFDDAWKLPLQLTDDPSSSFEPIPSSQFRLGEPSEFRHEAAFRVISNHDGIVEFACRGAGEAGRPSYHAELADPYAESNEDFIAPVDVCLRHVTNALLNGVDDGAGVATVVAAAVIDLEGKGGTGELREDWESYIDEGTGRTYFWNYETGDVSYTAPTRQLDTCLVYLRDRVGVPRDMNLPAAMQLRAHLNWCIDLMK
mmetsp:Transcript_4365/g.9773  ORF Transcript_4365/g.9773 Transcript_4365/m.9773 type:complete len:577 (-) Transcript_4365:24-1754(-)